MMNGRKIFFCLLAGFLAAVSGGCGDREEQTRTILLPPIENQAKGQEELYISHMQEYDGRDYSGDAICVEWGEPGTDLLYLLKTGDDSYLYQTIDTRTDTVINSIVLEEGSMTLSNISISPGGKYLAYESGEDGQEKELVLFSAERNKREVLHAWKDTGEIFSYIWSDDGNRFFSWQSGDTIDPYADWAVTCYETEWAPDNSFLNAKTQCLMKGGGYSWRIVLPNADGSQVYVREQFRAFGDSVTDEEQINADYESGSQDSRNWIFLPDTAKVEELPEYSREPVWPVKFTPAGLYIQEGSGALCLIENVRSQPVRKELFPGDPGKLPPVPYICENGDHVFFLEWPEDSLYQISGVRIVDGEADGKPVVLYQDNYENLIGITVLRDQAVTFWGKETLDTGWHRYKATMLEY